MYHPIHRPTRFLGVPRVWEKFHSAIVSQSQNAGRFKRKIAQISSEAGVSHHLHGNGGMFYRWPGSTFYSKVKAGLGLDRCEGFYTGAAPVSGETVKFFMGMDILLMDLYGQSEATGNL